MSLGKSVFWETVVGCLGEVLVPLCFLGFLWVGYRYGAPFWILVLAGCGAVLIGLVVYLVRQKRKRSGEPKDAT